MKNTVYFIIILLLAAGLVYFVIDKPQPVVKEVTITRHIHDTVFAAPDTVYEKIPYPVAKFINVHDTIKVNDTIYLGADVIKDITRYYSTRIYKDTIKLDTIGYLGIKEVIRKNTLVSRDYDIYIKKKFKIKPKPRFYTGFILGRNNITTYVKIDRHKHYNYVIGYDIYNQSPIIGVEINVNRLWQSIFP